MSLIKLTGEEYAKISTDSPLWQSLSWERHQKALGRETRLYGLKTSNLDISTYALVIIDRTAFGLSVWDIPRGPIGPDSSEIISQIIEEAKKDKCMALYFSGNNLDLNQIKSKTSDRHEQPEETLVIDLEKSEEEILAQMKQKGRYNIRLAEKNEIQVEKSKDIDSFYNLLSKTSGRDGFKIKPKSHYEKFLECVPDSFLLLAKQEAVSKTAIAGLIGAIHNDTGYYYYGASDYEYRNLMAPYALQWKAMRYCKEQGCKTYDLLGIGTHWEGVTRFKMQFGGGVRKCGEERAVIIKPILKWIIDIKRKMLF